MSDCFDCWEDWRENNDTFLYYTLNRMIKDRDRCISFYHTNPDCPLEEQIVSTS